MSTVRISLGQEGEFPAASLLEILVCIL